MLLMSPVRSAWRTCGAAAPAWAGSIAAAAANATASRNRPLLRMPRVCRYRRCKTWNIPVRAPRPEHRRIGRMAHQARDSDEDADALRELIREARSQRPLQPGEEDQLLVRAGHGDEASQE